MTKGELERKILQAKEHLMCADKDCVYAGCLPDVIHISDAKTITAEMRKDFPLYSEWNEGDEMDYIDLIENAIIRWFRK